MRPLNQPQPATLAAGQAVFKANCASCHGGAKWTKSQIFHRDNPAAIAQNGAPLDPGVTRLAPAPPVAHLANEFFSFTCNALTINYLEDVGTFDVTNPLEIRDNAAASTAFGVNGFNSSSLLSINYHAPYLHRGQAQTLEAVFPLHGLGPGGTGFPPTTTIQTQLTAPQRANLLVFLKSIDGTTNHLRSEGDVFRDTVRLQGAPVLCRRPAKAPSPWNGRGDGLPYTRVSTGPATKELALFVLAIASWVNPWSYSLLVCEAQATTIMASARKNLFLTSRRELSGAVPGKG